MVKVEKEGRLEEAGLDILISIVHIKIRLFASLTSLSLNLSHLLRSFLPVTLENGVA